MLLPIRDDLVKRGLGREIDSRWFEVEKTTANEYMVYLATAIEQNSEKKLILMTDQRKNLAVFLKDGASVYLRDDQRVESKVADLRTELLKRAFPAPKSPLNADDIYNFKMKHQDELPRFRNWVERKVTAIADLKDAGLRRKQLGVVKKELREETNRIRSNMRTHGWVDTVAGDFCAVLGAIPVVGQVPSIVHAIYSTLVNKAAVTESPLAYAAYAQRRLKLG